jgi:methyl-accepting chemotaxis protein
MRQGGRQQAGIAAERAIVLLIWGHGPLLAGAAWLSGNGIAVPFLLWLATSCCAALVQRMRPGSTAARTTVAAAFCLMPALLLIALAGHAWQVDAHMHFFAVLAVCAAMLDIPALLAGAAVVAVHHLLLNFAYAALVFPGGTDLGRVVFHAVILVFEAAALSCLIGNTVRALDAAERGSDAVAQLADAKRASDLRQSQERAAERRKALREMADGVEATTNEAVRQLQDDAARIAQTADGMAGLVNDVSGLSETVTRAAEQALGKANDVRRTAEALTGSIAGITGKVAGATEITRQAAVRGGLAAERIAALSEATARIGEVVQLIDSIASKTNLLALNATIEAARAGEAGRGFNVVASEVKALANQTGQSTAEIARQVTEIRARTAEAVAVVEDVGRALQDVSAMSADIAAAVALQSEATIAIARDVQDNASAVQDVSSGIAAVSRNAAVSREHAGTLRLSSASMADNVSVIKGRIVASMRANVAEVDRRQSGRASVDLPCVVSLAGGAYKARAVDLSSGGCQVDLPEAFDDGVGTIEFSGAEGGLRIACRVTALQRAGRAKVVFDGPSMTEHVAARLQALMQVAAA